MMRYSRIVQTKPGQPMYIASSAVFLAEVLKIVACLIVLYYEKRTFPRFWHVVQKEIIEKPGETMKMLIPSGLYAIQNNLLYVALSNLEAATFQVTYQMKILTTAIFSVVLLGRTLTQKKWFALVLLMIGVTLVQLQTVNASTTTVIPTAAALAATSPDEDPDSASAAEAVAAIIKSDAQATTNVNALIAAQNPLVGLLAVITSCVSSGFAGCYFEKILKTSDTSMWVRNIQLGLSGALFSFIGMVVYDRERLMDGGMLQGYDWLTWVVVMNQALGGLLVAIVVKYADNILKGFATSLSIIISGIISFYLFDFHPNVQFMAGAIIVMVSSYIYGRPEQLVGEKPK